MPTVFEYLTKIKFKKDDCTYYIIKYAAYYGSNELKAFVENAIKDNDYLKKVYADYEEECEKYIKPKNNTFTINSTNIGNGGMAFAYYQPTETVEANTPF